MIARNILTDTFVSSAGLQFRVREIQSQDAPYLIEIFEHMSADSRYHRWHRPVQNLTERQKWLEAERIAGYDPCHSGGIIAFANLPGKPGLAVAGARFVATGVGVAEVAVSVADEVQQQGVGMRLMQLLLELAQQRGMVRLTASIQQENQAIWKILQRLPYEVRGLPQGSYMDVVIELSKSQPRPAHTDIDGSSRS